MRPIPKIFDLCLRTSLSNAHLYPHYSEEKSIPLELRYIEVWLYLIFLTCAG